MQLAKRVFVCENKIAKLGKNRLLYTLLPKAAASGSFGGGSLAAACSFFAHGDYPRVLGPFPGFSTSRVVLTRICVRSTFARCSRHLLLSGGLRLFRGGKLGAAGSFHSRA